MSLDDVLMRISKATTDTLPLTWGYLVVIVRPDGVPDTGILTNIHRDELPELLGRLIGKVADNPPLSADDFKAERTRAAEREHRTLRERE